jgi:hypothetical protein
MQERIVSSMVDYSKRLDQLPETVIQTFHPDFLFLIYPDKIQHFPARGWTEEQKMAAFRERLGENLKTTNWHGHQIVYTEESVCFGLIPRENHK